MKTIDLIRRTVFIAACLFYFAAAPARADIAGFGDFSGWKINQNDPSAAPVISLSPSAIHLTGLDTFEARSIFYKTPQVTSQFTASFTYQETGGSANGNSAGFAFVLQNTSAGSNAVGGNGTALGYRDMTGPSWAVEFPLYSPYLAGVFTNGNTGTGTDSLSPVNLLSGDPINVSITYDGTFLRELATDTVTNQTSATGLHLISLPTTAYVGISAGSGLIGVDQLFSNFQFNTVPEPASFALFGVGAVGLLACLRRRIRTKSAC